ncbi:MAG: NAD-dependent epimerase/dehydratase family protein [Solibacillus sp.]
MNILVTGGAGYIGIYTCVALLEKGHKAFGGRKWT